MTTSSRATVPNKNDHEELPLREPPSFVIEVLLSTINKPLISCTIVVVICRFLSDRVVAMGDFLYSDPPKPKLDHPDSCIRLACAVHRFHVPKITKRVTFAKSFKTAGQNDKTRKLMLQADDTRIRLEEACKADKTSAERVISEAKRYQPLIHTILLSCKVQPEEARLDERLLFGWSSGIEHSPKAFKSEAIMYDLVMTIVCEALGCTVRATENSVSGEFAAASRDYAAAAGICSFLANDHLPQWISKGSNVNEERLPAECHAPFAKALASLFMANGQQMAVATVLIKPGTPNYGLLAKLSLGISEQLQDFLAQIRKDAVTQMNRLDSDFLTLVNFQIGLQKALSLYFQARDLWDKTDYGIAIALMSCACVALKTNDGSSEDGIPEISRTPLSVLKDDLEDLRVHMAKVLHSWEKDNSAVFFEKVPQHVPAGKKLQEGYKMNKATEFRLEPAEPVLLRIPEGTLERSDSDLARELSRSLNAGDADD